MGLGFFFVGESNKNVEKDSLPAVPIALTSRVHLLHCLFLPEERREREREGFA